MQMAWLTDIHLNFIGEAEFGPFCRKVVAESPDAVLIGGDIGEAHNVLNYLRRLESSLGLPIFWFFADLIPDPAGGWTASDGDRWPLALTV